MAAAVTSATVTHHPTLLSSFCQSAVWRLRLLTNLSGALISVLLARQRNLYMVLMDAALASAGTCAVLIRWVLMALKARRAYKPFVIFCKIAVCPSSITVGTSKCRFISPILSHLVAKSRYIRYDNKLGLLGLWVHAQYPYTYITMTEAVCQTPNVRYLPTTIRRFPCSHLV